MVELVALGQRAGQLVAADHSLLEQDLPHPLARAAALRHCLLDLLGRDQAHVHHHVAQEAATLEAAAGRGQPGRWAGGAGLFRLDPLAGVIGEGLERALVGLSSPPP